MVTAELNAPLSMRSVIGDYYLELGKQQDKRWAGMVASEFDTNQASEDYPFLDAAPALRRWDGDRSIRSLPTNKVTIFNDDWETTLAFRVPDFRRDKTRQIQARTKDLSQRVAFHPDKLLTSLLVSNGNAFDGNPFFSTSRSIGMSGTINNALAAGDGLAGGAAPSSAQQVANILLCVQTMMAFKDNEGEPLNEAAREFTIMTPASLYAATVTAVEAAFTSTGASNPLAEMKRKGMSFTTVINARLTVNNRFFLFRSDAGIKSLILQEEEVNPVALDRDSEHAKKTNQVLFGHGWAGGVGYGIPMLALQATTS